MRFEVFHKSACFFYGFEACIFAKIADLRVDKRYHAHFRGAGRSKSTCRGCMAFFWRGMIQRAVWIQQKMTTEKSKYKRLEIQGALIIILKRGKLI
ncbi:hypothetical protein D6853_10970 [Butyrivibrio sp. X503]|nr:hypothetical protein D6853_10970 [Butyrivibrio sp. X503]